MAIKTAPKKLTQKAAELLWHDLRSAFVNAEQGIVKIIETKAWEPLGYDTFSQAWADRMRGVKLANACTAQVVYALLDEGGLKVETAARLAHTTPAAVERLASQRAAGVPAALASSRAPINRKPITVVRSHERARPSAPSFIHLELPAEELADLKALCEAKGVDFKQEALQAVRAHFAKLARRRG